MCHIEVIAVEWAFSPDKDRIEWKSLKEGDLVGVTQIIFSHLLYLLLPRKNREAHFLITHLIHPSKKYLR